MSDEVIGVDDYPPVVSMDFRVMSVTSTMAGGDIAYEFELTPEGGKHKTVDLYESETGEPVDSLTYTVPFMSEELSEMSQCHIVRMRLECDHFESIKETRGISTHHVGYRVHVGKLLSAEVRNE